MKRLVRPKSDPRPVEAPAATRAEGSRAAAGELPCRWDEAAAAAAAAAAFSRPSLVSEDTFVTEVVTEVAQWGRAGACVRGARDARRRPTPPASTPRERETISLPASRNRAQF